MSLLVNQPSYSSCVVAWASAGMGKRGALAPSGNVVKCFCALVVTAKRSLDKLFVHYFHNLSSASGGKGAQTTTVALSLDPLGYFRPQTPNLPPPPGKILRVPMSSTVVL